MVSYAVYGKSVDISFPSILTQLQRGKLCEKERVWEKTEYILHP